MQERLSHATSSTRLQKLSTANPAGFSVWQEPESCRNLCKGGETWKSATWKSRQVGCKAARPLHLGKLT